MAVRTPSLRHQRAFAAAAVVALLGAQSASVAHAAFAAHETCAAHGELVEAPAQAEPAAIGEGFSPGDTAEQHQHDHCALALSAQPRATAAAQVREATQPGPASPVPPQAHALRVAGVDVLRFAPKASPPRG